MQYTLEELKKLYASAQTELLLLEALTPYWKKLGSKYLARKQALLQLCIDALKEITNIHIKNIL